MKNLAFLIGLFSILLFAGIASASICYQESTTVATSCGGLAGGTYTRTGTWNSWNMNDTNWDTYAYGCTNGGYSYFYPTYIIPANYHIKYIRYRNGCPTPYYGNLTVPSSCEYGGNVSFRIHACASGCGCADGTARVWCQNSTGWYELYNSSSTADGCGWLYEEGAGWEYLGVSFVSPTPNNNSIKSGSYFVVNVSATDGLDSCNITLDGTNYSMTVVSNTAYINNTGLSAGKHAYNVTCTNSSIGTVMTETRNVWTGGSANCTSCRECYDMASNADDYSTINLVNNIAGYGYGTSCIGFDNSAVDHVTFDCHDYSITSNASGQNGFNFPAPSFTPNIYNMIKNCKIVGYNLGVRFYQSGHNIVTNTNITNGNIGVWLQGSWGGNACMNNTIYNNWIYNNTYPIFVDTEYYGTMCNLNLIYNNYFNNTNNPYDPWSRGTPSQIWNVTLNCSQSNIIGGNCTGGNFYATTGKTGLSQLCPDRNPRDGICDGFVFIGGNPPNRDYLALKYPPVTRNCSGCFNCTDALVQSEAEDIVQLIANVSWSRYDRDPWVNYCIGDTIRGGWGKSYTTFDCRGYSIISTDVVDSYAIYLAGGAMNVINNCSMYSTSGILNQGSNTTVTNSGCNMLGRTNRFYCFWIESQYAYVTNGWSYGSQWGIVIDSGYNRNVFTNMTLDRNMNGVSFASQYNVLNDSRISNSTSGTGFSVSGANNFIYNNFIYNNSVSSSTANFWNTTKSCSVRNIINGSCIGGNFWSSYTGKDLTGDGIGDTYVPFVLGTNNNDFLPLTNELDVLYISQSPEDIDTINLFGHTVNITYNISFPVNVSTVALHFKTNTSTSDCAIYVNGVLQWCGFRNDSFESNLSDTWMFKIYDNQVYPAVYDYNELEMEQTPHLVYDINGHTSYLKMRFYNISSVKQYGMFEFMANNSGGVTVMQAHYCNDSYTTGDPDISPYCFAFGDLLGNVPFNHTHSAYSKHMLLPFAVNQTTGMIGNIIVTPTSYFILEGNSTMWHAYYIANDTGTAEWTTNAGSTWNALSGTVDAHLHQFEGNDSLWYYLYACDTSGRCVNSTYRQDLMQLLGLPPVAPDVNSPFGEYVAMHDIPVIYLPSISPNGYPIVSYEINLLDGSRNFMRLLDANNTVFGYTFAVLNSGSYTVSVTACDDQAQCTTGYSEIFRVVSETERLLSDTGMGMGSFLDAIKDPVVSLMLALGFIGGILVVVFAFPKAIGNAFSGSENPR